jgi:hypothetical protein
MWEKLSVGKNVLYAVTFVCANLKVRKREVFIQRFVRIIPTKVGFVDIAANEKF